MSADGGLEGVERAASAWEGVGLSARRAELDQQSLAVVDHQETSADGRESLKAVVRDFRSLPAAERPAKVGGLVKAFQGEVDALTRRAAFAEAAFFALYRSLESAPDPAPALREALGAAARGRRAEAEAEEARRELEEYRAELSGLKNQDHTLRRLQAQLREAEEHVDARVSAALAERAAGADAAAAAAEAAAAEREAELRAAKEAAQAELAELSKAHDACQERLYRLQEEVRAPRRTPRGAQSARPTGRALARG